MTGPGAAPFVLPRTRQYPLDPPVDLQDLISSSITRLRYTDGHVGWLVTSYATARTVIADRRFGLAGPKRSPVADPGKSPAILDALGPMVPGFLLEVDPPEHTVLRRAVAAHFSRSRVAALTGKIEEVVDLRLDAIEESGPPTDLVSAFALPVPSFVMCDLIRIPREDRHQFENPTSLMLDPSASSDATARAVLEFRGYVKGVMDQKRRQPDDDLLSRLLAEERLDDDRLAGMVMFLFIAGHETTASTIGMGAYALLTHSKWLDRLREEPDLIDDAVDELLRYLSVVESAGRVALEDVTIGSAQISKGDSVLISLNAANRDPAMFEEPNELDIGRSARRHVAFGHGIHICLGQHLARLETRIALGGLIQRFPDLELATTSDQIHVEGTDQLVTHIKELPVVW